MSAINRQDLAMVISRLRSREDFSMNHCTRCLMSDVCAVLNLGNPENIGYDRIGYAIGLDQEQSWELFFAGSVPSWKNDKYQSRNLASFTKDEALRVLDALMNGDKVEGIWGRTVGVRNKGW